MSKRVIILGAGYAGISTALTLYKMKKKETLEIVLIDKNDYHTFLTELHEVAGFRVGPETGKVSLKHIFQYTNVEVIKDEIVKFDFSKQQIQSETATYSYDYLVLATGSDPNYFNIPGMQEYSLPLWSYEHAIRIRRHIEECFAKASKEQDKEKRKRLLTFVIGGGGFTGIELIGEIALWKKTLSKEYKVDAKEVSILLVEALPGILQNLKKKNSEKAMRYLQKRLGVQMYLNNPVTSVLPEGMELKDGTKIETHTFIWTGGIRASNSVDSVDLEKARGFRLKVNEHLQTVHENVYAIGDVCYFEEDGKVLPAMVEGALQTGHSVAKNILADMQGKKKVKFAPNLHGAVVSVGSNYAVAELMNVSLPNALAVMAKHLILLHYLFEIGGFELVLRHLKHEFIEKKQRKTFLESHTTETAVVFWGVPLRIFLGMFILNDGIDKLFEIPTNDSVLGMIEIIVGAAMTLGAFTGLAALVTLSISVPLLASPGVMQFQYWIIPASIAMLGNTGKSFGLDCYITPYLMRMWRYFTRNKRFKICVSDTNYLKD